MWTPETVPFWTATAALAAALSVIVAAITTMLTVKYARQQAEPKIVAYATHDPERQTILTIRVKNIGNDVAREITFSSSRPLTQAFGLSEVDAEPPEPMVNGPLIDGIPLLAPGESRDVTWGQYGGLMKAVGRDSIHLTFMYRHGRRKLEGDSMLEVLSFIGTDDWAQAAVRSARSLENIAKVAEQILKEIRQGHEH